MDTVKNFGLAISVVQSDTVVRIFTHWNGEAQTAAQAIIDSRFNFRYIQF